MLGRTVGRKRSMLYKDLHYNPLLPTSIWRWWCHSVDDPRQRDAWPVHRRSSAGRCRETRTNPDYPPLPYRVRRRRNPWDAFGSVRCIHIWHRSSARCGVTHVWSGSWQSPARWECCRMRLDCWVDHRRRQSTNRSVCVVPGRTQQWAPKRTTSTIGRMRTIVRELLYYILSITHSKVCGRRVNQGDRKVMAYKEHQNLVEESLEMHYGWPIGTMEILLLFDLVNNDTDDNVDIYRDHSEIRSTEQTMRFMTKVNTDQDINQLWVNI